MAKHDPMGRGHENHRYGGKPPMTHAGGHSLHPIHHKRARGGGVGDEGEGHEDDREDKPPSEVYAGKGSRTEEEANRRKRGGKRADGGKAPAPAAKPIVAKTAPKMPALAVGGTPSRHIRMDRRGRARGGSVGADSHPLTEASKMTEAEGEKRHYSSLDPEDD